VVFVDESAEPVSTLGWAGSRSGWRVGWLQGEAAMGPLLVVVLEVADEDAAEMALVVDEDPVEALAADRADDAFGVGVRDRRAHRRQDHSDTFDREDLVKDAGELRVTITDEDADVVEDAADREVAGLLGDPRAGRVRGDSRQVHAAGAVVDEEQDVESAEQDRVDAEEVAGKHAAGLGGEELAPGRPVSTRCRLQTGCDEDAADGAR
jgi:hypothetical protein